MVMFSFNLIAIVCVIANLFLLTKIDIIVHFNKFLNLGVYPRGLPRYFSQSERPSGPFPKLPKKIPGEKGTQYPASGKTMIL